VKEGKLIALKRSLYIPGPGIGVLPPEEWLQEYKPGSEPAAKAGYLWHD
jgi:hypothetical protein